MEFPLTGLVAMNSSEAAGGQLGSLYSRKPVLASFYVVVLGVAAVVGTLGNLIVIVTVIIKHIRGRRTTGNGVGRAFIANLALSDLVVTAVINPIAIAGLCIINFSHYIKLRTRPVFNLLSGVAVNSSVKSH